MTTFEKEMVSVLPTLEFPQWLKARYPKLTTVTFHSPPEVPEEEVGKLPALCGYYEGGVFDGGPHMRTYWVPSPEEIEAINNGALVELIIFGDERAMPPLALNVELP
jgi:hypothetical protein